MPGIPEERVGPIVAMAIMCYAGDPGAGERALAPFRALAQPVLDALKPMRYPEIYPPDDPEYRPLAEARTMFIDRVDGATARLILERLAASDSPMRVAQLRVLGGAIARVPDEATAYAHRQRTLLGVVAAFYDGEADREVKQAWMDATVSELPLAPGGYVNFVNEVGDEHTRAAYPDATWRRLATIKRRYDPDNLFRRCHNVPPAGDASGAAEADRIHVHRV